MAAASSKVAGSRATVAASRSASPGRSGRPACSAARAPPGGPLGRGDGRGPQHEPGPGRAEVAVGGDEAGARPRQRERRRRRRRSVSSRVVGAEQEQGAVEEVGEHRPVARRGRARAGLEAGEVADDERAADPRGEPGEPALAAVSADERTTVARRAASSIRRASSLSSAESGGSEPTSEARN